MQEGKSEMLPYARRIVTISLETVFYSNSTSHTKATLQIWLAKANCKSVIGAMALLFQNKAQLSRKYLLSK